MAQLRCTATSCYMPTGDKAKKGKHQIVERFEDGDRETEIIYEVEDHWVETYLNSGNFEVVEG